MAQQQQFTYGGQAVIEGVMIRGRHVYSVAARRPDGTICTELNHVPVWGAGSWRKIPLLRGTLVLIETLVVGMKALTFSAQIAAGEEGKENDKPIPAWSLALTIALSLGLGIGLFFVLPLVITHSLVDRFVSNSVASNFTEGVLRLLIFIAYISLIGMMPSIRRVFAYHAAEHMAVHAHEHRLPLDTANVRKFPAAHPRCGTAFLLTVMLVSIVVFALLGTPALPLRIASRILLIPLIAGVSYEVIRFNARHEANALVRLLTLPSLAMQKLTTRPPDDQQIEVAIAAMNTAIEGDRSATAAAPAPNP
ncbi:MAG: DUF1385 domain-containing protein [SAR202 cluster bacterium]|nr:DUF1385 domain-containing protein [SAR202 cluster bacterium]